MAKDLSGYYKKYDDDITLFTESEARDFVRSLRRDMKNDEAIEVGRNFLSMCPLLHTYLNDYCYAIYNKHINIPVSDIQAKESLFYSFAKDILELTKQEQYSPYEVTINKLIRYEMSKDPIDYTKCKELLYQLDYKLLSKEELKFKDGKTGESNLEKWYRQAIKCDYELGNYQECIELCNKALGSIKKFHHRNLPNIQYTRAICYGKLERYEDAQRDFLALQGKVQDVNFFEVLYKTYSGLNQDKKANAFLVYDLYNAGYNQESLSIYKNLVEACTKANYEKLATIATKLVETMEEEIKTKSDLGSGNIYDDMMDELTGHLGELVKRQEGKVVYYNDEKQLGNIQTPQDERLFFMQRDYIFDEDVERNDIVEYTVLPTYDRKKDIVTSKAVLITYLYQE